MLFMEVMRPMYLLKKIKQNINQHKISSTKIERKNRLNLDWEQILLQWPATFLKRVGFNLPDITSFSHQNEYGTIKLD